MDNSINDVKQRVGENFEQMKEKLSERTNELQSTIQQFVDENPLRAVGIAFGVGYLLSGALFSRTTMRVAGLGGRLLFGSFLKNLLVGVGPAFMASMSGESEGGQQPRGGNGGSRPST